MDDQTLPGTAISHLVIELVHALIDVGLSAEPFGASMVWVANRAADPPGDDPHAARMSPGLRQVVQCRTNNIGHLGWHWVWSVPGEMPTYEWFAPADRTAEAAAKIARVLALRPQDAAS